jgi:hypothetical protein
MENSFESLSKIQFRKIIIADSRNLFSVDNHSYEPLTDLVLTFDFALKKDVEKIGGIALYLDHLCSQDMMQENNFLMYQFYKDWHYDRNGKDIFSYRNIDFGLSFRIEICQDFIYYGRLRLCLSQLKKIEFEILELFTKDIFILDILKVMNLKYSQEDASLRPLLPDYFFPIKDWMEMRLRERSIRQILRDTLMSAQSSVMSLFDLIVDIFIPSNKIFIQEYIPTRGILKLLQKTRGVRVVQAHYSAPFSLKKLFFERLIPVHLSFFGNADRILKIIEDYRNSRSARLVLSDGTDITCEINAVIERQVIKSLPRILRDLDSVIKYLNTHPLKLVVLIGNVGQLAMLVDCVAKSRGVPSYLIINGFLGNAYMDEGKYANFINSYSTSIRDNYFRGMKNVLCLGDPRMDEYAFSEKRTINRLSPTITIGTAGFNSSDLNSYVAFEFDFLYDVLSAIQNVANSRNLIINLNIKVRPNGYIEQYKSFVKEYFPLLKNVNFIDSMPMKLVLEKTDFYITFYSQTLFEASTLGIPVAYYRKDNEIMDSPFDGKSELVTLYNIEEITDAVVDFIKKSNRYEKFLKKEVMEKYIGSLDGKNTERNLRHIYGMLS